MQIVQWIISIASLVCYILVLVKMFQNGQTGLGIACILLTCVCGIGALIAFIYGWIKSGEWGIRNVMIAWTVLIIASIVLSIVAGPVVDPEQFKQQFSK
jgi:hypothetical protein